MRGLACNCSQSGLEVGGTNKSRSGMGAAPSWYDNIYNEVSSSAENLWNDVEGMAVWGYNSVENFAQSTFPGTAPPPQNRQQAQQRSAELGPFAPVANVLDSVDPSSPQYDPNTLYLLIGVVVLVALAPSLNNLTK